MNRQQIEATFGSSEYDSIIPARELPHYMPYGGISIPIILENTNSGFFTDLDDERRDFRL